MGVCDDPAAALARVSVHDTLEQAVAGVALVQENGPETVEAKIALFKALDSAAPTDAILASSSSAIVASRFTEGLAGRHRCLIAHPVNPPHVVPVVELCGAPWTAPEAIARARAIYGAIGQVPVEVKREIDGFILNRMQAVLLAEAFRLVADGYCTAEDLDKTIADGLGMRWSFMGPFQTIELNAPGGIADYCKRYGATLDGLAKSPTPADPFSPAAMATVATSFGPAPTPGDVLARSQWRDQRLAALAAHKRMQPKRP
jgi:3-hydroxyacyl-CoA dehydrogenase